MEVGSIIWTNELKLNEEPIILVTSKPYCKEEENNKTFTIKSKLPKKIREHFSVKQREKKQAKR